MPLKQTGVASFFDDDTSPRQTRAFSTKIGMDMPMLGGKLELGGMTRKKVGEKLHETIEALKVKFTSTHDIAIQLGGKTAEALRAIEDAKKGIKTEMKYHGSPDASDVNYENKKREWDTMKHKDKVKKSKEAIYDDAEVSDAHDLVQKLGSVNGFSEPLPTMPAQLTGQGLLAHTFKLKRYVMLRKKADIKHDMSIDGESRNAELYHDFMSNEVSGEELLGHIKQLKEKLKEFREAAKAARAKKAAPGGDGEKKKRKRVRKSKFFGPANIIGPRNE